MKENYGLTHGLICFGIIAAVHFLAQNYIAAMLAGVAASFYYFKREKDARLRDGVTQFRDWYLDSQMDAIVPVLVTLGYIGWIYVTQYQ